MFRCRGRRIFVEVEAVMDAILTVAFRGLRCGILEDIQVKLLLAPGIWIVNALVLLLYDIRSLEPEKE